MSCPKNRRIFQQRVHASPCVDVRLEGLVVDLIDAFIANELVHVLQSCRGPAYPRLVREVPQILGRCFSKGPSRPKTKDLIPASRPIVESPFKGIAEEERPRWSLLSQVGVARRYLTTGVELVQGGAVAHQDLKPVCERQWRRSKAGIS